MMRRTRRWTLEAEDEPDEPVVELELDDAEVSVGDFVSFTVDRSKYLRGVDAHEQTVELLAGSLPQHGLVPLSNGSSSPRVDIAWRNGDVLKVGEVKSITAENEEEQLRYAYGQVSRYCHQLRSAGVQCEPVVVVEREPFDTSWIEFFRSEGVDFIWPEIFDRYLNGESLEPMTVGGAIARDGLPDFGAF